MSSKKPVPCPNNEGVYCAHTADCENCGWNPDEEAEQSEAIRRDMKRNI